MYEKQCTMHTLYDCFVNECDPCVLFVVVSVFATVDRVEFYHVSWVPASDKRKLSFDTFTFDTLVFSLNFNVGLNMLFCFISYS